MEPGPEPVRLDLPPRALLLVAGIPGAGKSTLLAGMSPDPRVSVHDSDGPRAALRRMLPGLPYGCYRWLVHLCHRTGALVAAVSRVPVVVVHLPATDPGTRAAVARLAALTGRSAHLLWLDVAPAEARRGQETRGRLVPGASFARHAEAARTLPGCAGWASVTVTDRAGVRGGLRLAHETGVVAQ
ncbi:MAG: Zeta toxin [Pseudonocardiales bacterium]|nr:Zeta toxin [Pseudonocardiales bacterium]